MSSSEDGSGRHLVTLGMFIVDEFAFADENGCPTAKTLPPQGSYYLHLNFAICAFYNGAILQIGGGGTYAVIGARIWSDT